MGIKPTSSFGPMCGKQYASELSQTEYQSSLMPTQLPGQKTGPTCKVGTAACRSTSVTKGLKDLSTAKKSMTKCVDYAKSLTDCD